MAREELACFRCIVADRISCVLLALCLSACNTRPKAADETVLTATVSLQFELAHGGSIAEEPVGSGQYVGVLPVGQRRLALIPRTSTDTPIQIEGVTIRNGAMWTSSDLAPGEHDFRVWVTGEQKTGGRSIRVDNAWRRTRLASTAQLEEFGGCELSADGRELAAVGLGWQAGDPEGTEGSLPSVYRFERIRGDWFQKERLYDPHPHQPCFFGGDLAMSADGGTVGVVVRACEPYDDVFEGGDVELFDTRGQQGTFVQTLERASGPNGEAYKIAISGKGDTIAVGAQDATGTACEEPLARNEADVKADRHDPKLPDAGAVYVYRRTSEGSNLVACLKARFAEAKARFGADVAMSIDGRVLAVGAALEAGGGKGTNADERDHSAPASGAVYVFEQGGDGTWRQSAYLKASNANAGDFFGSHVSLSADGHTLAVTAAFEKSAATGINGDQRDKSNPWSGAVYVFEKKHDAWVQSAYIKRATSADQGAFAKYLVLSGDGNTMAVASGPKYNQHAAGSVQMMHKIGGRWSYGETLVAPYSDLDDRFGDELAISHDGTTLVVEIAFERQADRTKPKPWAAYVFDAGRFPSPVGVVPGGIYP